MSKKSAVTYHLMPLYYNPRLHAALSPRLKGRMQGKTCFNFQRPDPELFAALEELTRLGRAQWERAGLLESGPMPPERLAAAARSAGVDMVAVEAKRQKVVAQATARRKATRAKQSKAKKPAARPRGK
jgi:hypothetical protein